MKPHCSFRIVILFSMQVACASSRDPFSVRIGEVGEIVTNGENILAGGTKESLDATLSSIMANDLYAIELRVHKGTNFLIPKGTSVLVLDYGSFEGVAEYQVRILTGEFKQNVVWVTAEKIQPKKQP